MQFIFYSCYVLDVIVIRQKIWNTFLSLTNPSAISDHTSSVERFSENFDDKAVTYLIFFVGTH